jgi:hypothetical protein
MMNRIIVRISAWLLLCALLLYGAAGATATLPPDLSRADVVAYFREITFAAEYGGGSDFPLRRWESPIRVKVYGSPTDGDLQALDRHIGNLNGVDGMPFISRVTSDENVELYFVPLDRIPSYISGYVEGNWGFFWCWWNDEQQLTKAQIAIATDVTNQKQRNHLILEEFTQALGMMQDSYLYEDSIFYGEWTEVQELSPLDWQIIRMTYSTLLNAGMSEAVAVHVLEE